MRTICIICFSLLYPAVLQAETRCQDTMQLVKKSLPKEIGNNDFLSDLLKPEFDTKQLSQRFNREQLIEAMDDVLRLPASECQTGGQDNTGNKADTKDRDSGENTVPNRLQQDKCGSMKSRVKINLAQGKVTYLNPERSFKFNKNQANRVQKAVAEKLALNLLESIGVPVKELGRSEVRELIAAGRDSKNKLKPSRLRAELHVRVGRKIGNLPVFDSEAKVAVSSKAQAARLHLSWPDFVLEPKLAQRKPHSPDTIIQMATKALSGKNQCNKYSRINSVIAYAPSSTKRNSDRKIRYIPSLIVYAIPPEPKEDSGQIAQPGVQVTIPLIN